MRRLRTDRLLAVFWVIIGCLVFVFIPYWLGVLLSKIPAFAVTQEPRVPFLWFQGIMVTVAFLGTIGILYLAFDWFFPKDDSHEAQNAKH